MILTEELAHRIHQAHEFALSRLRAHATEVIEDGGKKRPRFSPRTTESMTSLLALMFKVEHVWGENTVAGKAADVVMDYFVATAEAFGLRDRFMGEYPWYAIRMGDHQVRELKEQFEQVA